MSRWPGRLITRNPVTPGGAAPTASAPGIWTLPEMAYWNKQGLWPSASADPYWSYVSFLLGTTATNAQQNNTFLDSSGNNFTLTRSGNTTQGAFTPYGTLWSNYLNGSNYLSSATATAPGTGDFTVEGWFNMPSIGSTRIMYDCRPSGTNGAYQVIYVDLNGYLSLYANSADQIKSTNVVSLNVWNHFALCRSGTSTKLFLNGVQQGSTYTDTNNWLMGASRPIIGTDGVGPGVNNFIGYLSNIRSVNGTALYTAAFTPPQAPLTAISGTSLLTCQSNRFKDNSTNALAITATGSPSVAAFSPFILAPPGYDRGAVVGSGYFDGSGDGLSISSYSSSALAFGTSDFTIEFWAFATTAPNNNWTPFFTMGTSGGGQEIRISQNINGTGFGWIYPNNTNNGDVYAGYGSMTTNTWHHIAMTRSGSTMRLFLDGTVVATGTGVSFNFTNTTLLSIGLPQPAYADGAFTGYLSNLRIVKGTAVYTAAFTPPTAPLTAISGTGLLCNFTNAGIFDASMQNNLETVGNAQVSSAQAKYGPTSAYFDGSGDYLVAPSSPVFDLGGGNFTIECWFNANSFAAPFGLASRYAVSGTASGWLLQVRSATSIRFLRGNDLYFDSTVSTMSTGTWYHVAAVRNGSTITVYLNGTQVGQATGVANFTDAATTLQIGRTHTVTDDLNGYIDDLRITRGYARYTANFTPPTAALPIY